MHSGFGGLGPTPLWWVPRGSRVLWSWVNWDGLLDFTIGWGSGRGHRAPGPFPRARIGDPLLASAASRHGVAGEVTGGGKAEAG